MRLLLPALAAGAAARSHRVAVLVSGTRSYTNATWDSLKAHVLDALEARGTAYEAFACGEPGQAVPSFATEVAASHATPEARLAACYAAAVRLRRPSLFCPSVCYSGPSQHAIDATLDARLRATDPQHAIDTTPRRSARRRRARGGGARRAPPRPSSTRCCRRRAAHPPPSRRPS